MNKKVASVFVAVGSNIEPHRNLRRALDGMRACFGPLQVSPAYRNRAVGFEGDDFVNLVVGFDTDQSVDSVRTQLQAVEADCGRPREAPKWAPRSMDLDLLLFGDLVIEQPTLTLPRPDLVRRAYMLKPLADLVPDLVHPTLHKTIAQLWREFDAEGHEMREVTLSGCLGCRSADE